MTTPTRRRRQTTRKSLRQSLKELLQRGKRQTNAQAQHVGSGILRRADTTDYLPEPSRVSFFPDFESSTQFDIDSYSASIPNHFASEVETVGEALFSSPLASRLSLLPATRLSQFNLNQSYVDHGRPYRPTQLTTVPEILIEGASRQASLVSLNTVKLSRSTLRIRESNQSLSSDRWSQSGVSCTSTNLTSQPRSRGSLEDLRSLASFETKIEDTPMSDPRVDRNRTSTSRGGRQIATSSGASISSIKHFGSFCVLDTYAPGCPVAATSEDLKYVFDVGEHFFLNNQECTDASMDIVTGFDAAGNEVTHLVLFSPLISPSSGRSRFLLAALIDVTYFIKDAATVPELDTISEEESVMDEAIATPVYRQSDPMFRNLAPGKHARYELSCEDLLGGCCIGENQTSASPSITDRGIVPGMGMYSDMMKGGLTSNFDDIWTDLAREEMAQNRKKSPSTASSHSTPKSTPPLSSRSSNTSKVDDVLDSFMSELQQLYSDFFLLAKSPLDAGFYEICNVSPSVYVSKDYVHGHLSHSSPDTITRLSEHLAGDTAFDMDVRWGIQGGAKQMYCIPLFGQRDLTWACILVDMQLGLLW